MSEPTDAPTTEPADEQPSTDVVSVDKELAMFAEYAKTLQIEDPAEVQERILRTLMTATSADDILRAGDAMPAADIVDVALAIHDIRASESTFEEGADLYLHVDAKIISNGDQVTFSCGARDVVMKLIRLHQLRLLPVECVIKRATKPTQAGFYPLFLRMLAPDDRPFT